jgi:hypothetical protein
MALREIFEERFSTCLALEYGTAAGFEGLRKMHYAIDEVYLSLKIT